MKNLLIRISAVIAALILLQTLYFKFSAHPESVELFKRLGVEPWGRIGTGIIELVAGILLFIPKTIYLGALLTLGLMTGAILSHVFVIGISSNNDGGFLFLLACITLLIASFLTLVNLKKIISIFKKNN